MLVYNISSSYEIDSGCFKLFDINSVQKIKKEDNEMAAVIGVALGVLGAILVCSKFFKRKK
mgnify:CR=1 FL=1